MRYLTGILDVLFDLTFEASANWDGEEGGTGVLRREVAFHLFGPYLSSVCESSG